MVSEYEELEDKVERERRATDEKLNKALVMLNNHETYISDGKHWRLTVVGLVVGFLLQIGGGLYIAGQLTERLQNVIRLVDRVQDRQDGYEKEFKELIREGRTYFRDNALK